MGGGHYEKLREGEPESRGELGEICREVPDTDGERLEEQIVQQGLHIRESEVFVSDSDDERIGRRLEQPQKGQERGDVADAVCTRLQSRGFGHNSPRISIGGSEQAERFSDKGQWSVEPNVGRVANGVPMRIHRIRCLGNGVVPQVAQVIGEAIIEAFGDKEVI
jgi:hypothetical protein